MQNDQFLIERLKNKESRALSNLYDRYSGAIYGVIIRICKNEAQAQDVLQETFVTIWQKIDSYDPQKGRFYTWAYRIARNKTLNSLRKSSDLIQSEDLSVYENEEADDDNTRDYTSLKGSIKKLESHHQRAIELIYFEGHTHREAHKLMDVPLGTFKSYVRQALKRIREDQADMYLLVVLFTEWMI